MYNPLLFFSGQAIVMKRERILLMAPLSVLSFGASISSISDMLQHPLNFLKKLNSRPLRIRVVSDSGTLTTPWALNSFIHSSVSYTHLDVYKRQQY